MEDIFEICDMYWPHIVSDSIGCDQVGPNELILRMSDGSKWCFDNIDKSIRRLPSSDVDDPDKRWLKEFGERLHILMRSRGMSQRMLSEMVNISQPTLSKYLRGETEPNLFNAARIARALRCDINDLVDF